MPEDPPVTEDVRRTILVIEDDADIARLIHPGRVFSRDRLLAALWGEDCFVLEHNLDVHIHALRRKLERDPKHPALLLTVRGVGYKLADGDPP